MHLLVYYKVEFNHGNVRNSFSKVDCNKEFELEFIVFTALLVRVQCLRKDLYKAVEMQNIDLPSFRWSLGHTYDVESVLLL